MTLLHTFVLCIYVGVVLLLIAGCKRIFVLMSDVLTATFIEEEEKWK